MPDLEASVVFYQQVFDAVLLFQGEQTAYFELAGLWLALNVQDSIPRQELRRSYTHIAFAADEADISEMKHRLQRFGVPLLPDHSRAAGVAAFAAASVLDLLAAVHGEKPHGEPADGLRRSRAASRRRRPSSH